MENCPYRCEVKSDFRQSNALRMEVIQPMDRCAAKPKPWVINRNIDTMRWILSGGSPMDVYEYCTNCIKYKEGEGNNNVQ